MNAPLTVFEVSWEVAQKVGGIHTVLSTKARSLVERLGDRYVCVGPWRLADPRRAPTFEDEPGFSGFSESCRALGVPVRVGRWLVPGRPRALLVDASASYRAKDELLGRLWDQYRVDSLFGAWDYVEPTLFGLAAGVVIERWWQEFVAPRKEECVVHAHEWMAGGALLHVKARVPAIGTVFTTHATVLGRALAGTGASPEDGLSGRTPEQAAESLGVRSKHSLEAVCAREADVTTTVGEAVADEVTRFLGRRPTPLLVNGIDPDAFDALSAATDRAGAAAALRRLAAALAGGEPADATLVVAAGRNEPRAKGFDVLVDALARLDRRPGPPVVAFFFVPVGVSGVRRDVVERMAAGVRGAPALPGVATHHVYEGETDPIARACAAAGLDNGPGRRVRVVHVADYASPGDGLLDLPYEAILRGADLACFPSAYEPWGYTPIESLAAGVPTVTSDRAGFGRWALARGLAPADGVTVLARRGVADADAAEALAETVDRCARGDATVRARPERCRAAVAPLAWDHALEPQERAYALARSRAGGRALGAAAAWQGPAPDATPRRDGGTPDVEGAMPAALRGLVRLSRNLAWTWDPDAPALFSALAGDAWEAARHNPVALLADAPAADLSAEAGDPALVARTQAALARLDALAARGPRLPAQPPPPAPVLSPWPPLPAVADGPAVSPSRPVAYFCAEFALHESLPVYSGGLGVLAGDHLKAASDEGLPLVAVGLFYRRGYLRQRVSVLGEQVPLEVENVPRDLPVTLVRDATGAPLRLDLDLPGTTIVLVAWRVDVGTVPLYLLDADVPENRPEDRAVTHRLYAGDAEMRLRQEIVLGKGGVRLLARLGIEPAVVHLNEGHAAFAPLERVSRLVHGAGLTFEEAAATVRATTVFTTHTPVPAGHDRFPEPLLRRYFSDVSTWVGIPWERFLALGRGGNDPEFNLTYLGLRMSASRNGVSRLHGEVSRRLLAPCWPGVLEAEVPVGHVTNGVHLATWAAPAVTRLLGAGDRPVTGADYAQRAADLDLDALWAARAEPRRALLDAVRAHVRAACEARRETEGTAERLTAGFTPDAMLLGFARRFATYKRADLLLRDLRRLGALVGRADRPVRILFAGKAHPSDRAGQDVLRRIVLASRGGELVGKVLFLEDYDMGLARLLVQGVDAWLNTPVRGLEASGTSGMKAAANGGLHVSVRDGWWDEAYDGSNGFAVGDGAPAAGRDAEDALDATSLFRVLEDDVVARFFDRGPDGVPRRWLETVRRSLATLPTAFDAGRMLREYADRAYFPLADTGLALARDGYALARAAAARHVRVRRAFPAVRVATRRPSGLDGVRGGERRDVEADVELAGLSPDDVLVEAVVSGGPGGQGGAVAATLSADGAAGGARRFRGVVEVPHDARRALSVRVRACVRGPQDAGLSDLVVWG